MRTCLYCQTPLRKYYERQRHGETVRHGTCPNNQCRKPWGERVPDNVDAIRARRESHPDSFFLYESKLPETPSELERAREVVDAFIESTTDGCSAKVLLDGTHGTVMSFPVAPGKTIRKGDLVGAADDGAVSEWDYDLEIVNGELDISTVAPVA